MNECKLEVCAENLAAVEAALAGGAHRVELCSNLALDGLTPDDDTISRAVILAREAGRPFDIMVLVRPRPGDFIYTDDEKLAMVESIRHICRLGADGIVIGALKPDMTVDATWIKEAAAIGRAHGLSVTFHRAFDHVADFSDALETLVEIGVDRILTSGGCADVNQGMDNLAALHRLARGRISIMPGGGVTSDNIGRLRRTVGATEFHGSCRKLKCDGLYATDVSEVKRIVDILNEET